jgi:hypothetical protein
VEGFAVTMDMATGKPLGRTTLWRHDDKSRGVVPRLVRLSVLGSPLVRVSSLRCAWVAKVRRKALGEPVKKGGDCLAQRGGSACLAEQPLPTGFRFKRGRLGLGLQVTAGRRVDHRATSLSDLIIKPKFIFVKL